MFIFLYVTRTFRKYHAARAIGFKYLFVLFIPGEHFSSYMFEVLKTYLPASVHQNSAMLLCLNKCQSQICDYPRHVCVARETPKHRGSGDYLRGTLAILYSTHCAGPTTDNHLPCNKYWKKLPTTMNTVVRNSKEPLLNEDQVLKSLEHLLNECTRSRQVKVNLFLLAIRTLISGHHCIGDRYKSRSSIQFLW